MSFTRIFQYRNTIRIFINTAYKIQTTEYCKAGISKHVSFFININLIEISRSCFLNSAYLRDFLFLVNFNTIHYSRKACLRITSL